MGWVSRHFLLHRWELLTASSELNVLLNVLNRQRLSILDVFSMAKTVGLNDILVVMGMKVFYILM